MLSELVLTGLFGLPLYLTPAKALEVEAPAAPRADDFVALSVAPQDEEVEAPAETEWVGSVTAGVTNTSGNSDTTTANLALDAIRESEKDRWTLKSYLNYNDTEDDDSRTITRSSGANIQYDRFINEDWYWLANAGLMSDSEAELDLRWVAGGGIGYRVWKEEQDGKKLDLEAGLVYFSEKYENEDDEYLSARLAEHFGYQVNEKVRYDHDFAIFPSLEDSDDWYFRFDNRLRADLTESFFAQFQVVFDYDNTPAEDSDGDELDELDTRIVAGVGWAF